MSVDGPGLFADDTAFDVRDEFREALTSGMSDDEATAKVLEEFSDDLDDVDTAPVVWLALAYTQSKLGRLDGQVRAKALEVIDSGADMARWHGATPSDRRKRAVVLAKLRAQLDGPQPSRRRIRTPSRTMTTVEVGQVIGYRAPSGRLFLLRASGLADTDHFVAPVVRLLDYFGTDVPTADALESIPDYGPRRGWSLTDRVILEQKRERPEVHGLQVIGKIPVRDGDVVTRDTITTWPATIDRLRDRDRELSGADPAP